MAYTKEEQYRIYHKTKGYCHLCGKRLALKNYGVHGSRGEWNVDHSKAQKNDGTDHFNNLYAACIYCNSSKGIKSSRSVRRANGLVEIPGVRKKSSGGWTILALLVSIGVVNAIVDGRKERRMYNGW